MENGSRRATLEAEFMSAMRGVGIASVKKVLSKEIPSALFEETSKAALAARYAKGKMSTGGELESQAFRKMNVDVLGESARLAHESRPRVALNTQGSGS